MSGSVLAWRDLTRCRISIDSGISEEPALDPDDEQALDDYAASMRAEEEGYRERIDLHAPAIEVVFDELETAGRRFLSPGDGEFESESQQATRQSSRGFELFQVTVAAEPGFDADALDALVARVVNIFEPQPPQSSPPVEDADDRPGVRDVNEDAFDVFAVIPAKQK